MTTDVVQAERERSALTEVCRRLGYDNGQVVLLRRGTNAVFRIGSDVVARLAPTGVGVEAIRQQVAVARWLAQGRVPAVRALDVEQPIEVAGRLVTLWESVGDGHADDLSQYGTAAELGVALGRLHSLSAPTGLDLPVLSPVDRLHQRLGAMSHLGDGDRALLRERSESLAERYGELAFVLPTGPIHGDASVGNLLRTREGGAVLADLDSFATGPREWDLVLTAMFADRYGWHTEAEYQAFVEAYGYDLREWGGYEVLADVRELLMVLWNAGNAATSEEHARELRKRLDSLRTGRGRDEWTPL